MAQKTEQDQAVTVEELVISRSFEIAALVSPIELKVLHQ